MQEMMAQWLPKRGIAFRQIPRLEVNGRTVSASAVRQAIHNGAFETVRDMLPENFCQFFVRPEGMAMQSAMQSQNDIIHH